MSYDIGGGYDGWRTATPWDDEVSRSISFTCEDCDIEYEDYEVTVGRNDDDTEVTCDQCQKTIIVDLSE